MEAKELLQLLEAAQDVPVSHVDLSASTKRIKVDMDTRKITGHKEFGVIRDHLAENIIFEVKRYKGDTDLAEKHCAIHWENGENGGVLPVTEVDLSEDGFILMRWELSDEFTQNAGDITYALHFFSIIDGGFTYHAATNAEHGKLGTTLNASAHSRNKITPSEIEVYIAKMNALSAEIDRKIASLEMTDEQAQQAVNNYLAKNPVKDGADGKSAYEFAKDGGYTGTEAEFAEKLAMEVASKEEVSQLSSEKVDKTGITLDKDSDGLIYIFIDGKPVGNGVEVTGEIVEGDVIGTFDENNNILLSGDIAVGTYTLSFVSEDGTYTGAGSLVVGEVDSEPEEPDTPNYTNFADSTSADWQEGYRLSISSGSTSELEGHTTTNYIPCKVNDVIRVKGLTIVDPDTTSSGGSNSPKFVLYDANKSKISGLYGIQFANSADAYGLKVTTDGDISTYIIAENNSGSNKASSYTAYIRFDGFIMDGYISEDVIITVNEEIPNYTNLADPTSADWINDARMSYTGTVPDTTLTTKTLEGSVITNYVDIVKGDIIKVEGINFTDSNNRQGLFRSDGTLYLGVSQASALYEFDSICDITYDANSLQYTIVDDSIIAKARFSGLLTGTADDVVITITRNGIVL